MTDLMPEPGRQIRVVTPGLLCTVQDRGRTGFQSLGVSVSGAADIDSLEIANRLVGNEPDEAGLEITLGGAEMEFSHTTEFAVAGAETGATLDGVPLARNIRYMAHAGAHLIFGLAPTGLRVYLAIAGGVDTPGVLGSRSTHVASGLGGLDGKALSAGDSINIGVLFGIHAEGPFHEIRDTDDPDGGPLVDHGDIEIRVIMGPQEAEFTSAGLQTFLHTGYVVSDQSNRQGLRLDGETIESKSGRYDIVSDAVAAGSIQVPGDGKPIVLLADRQTTGGYAKIAAVVSVDLPKLGQARPGTTLRFSVVSIEEAQELLAERADRMSAIRPRSLVDKIVLRVDGNEVSVGVTERDGNGSSQTVKIAEIDGATYPITVQELPPLSRPALLESAVVF
ncbi:MAG: biotin-dependent carboxyltransferase family protein [Chloroflexi bacterium]|nr:biotin-dependent carboxyltransferase family protein [Chloroflexota bacterium]